MDRERAAAAALSHKRAKQAAGAARKLARLSAQASERPDTFAVCELRRQEDLHELVELCELALSEHGRLDAVLLTGPASEDRNHHHGPNGAKEPDHHEQPEAG